eukprot:261976-Chlamydomonas_euryale.AAC.5
MTVLLILPTPPSHAQTLQTTTCTAMIVLLILPTPPPTHKLFRLQPAHDALRKVLGRPQQFCVLPVDSRLGVGRPHEGGGHARMHPGHRPGAA